MYGASVGPVSEQVKAAVRGLVEADQTRLGQVHRGLQRGLSSDAIAVELGVKTSNFVWNYKVIADALLEGKVPASPHIAKQAAGRSRALRAAVPIPDDVREYLVALEAQLDRHAVGARRSTALTQRASSSDVNRHVDATTGRSPSLVAAIRSHLETIDRSIAVDVLEYRGLLAVRDVEGALERLLTGGRASTAFRELERAGRLDLTLEELAVELGDHVSPAAREAAQVRLAYYAERGAAR